MYTTLQSLRVFALSFICLILLSFNSKAQDAYQGTEFYVSFMKNSTYEDSFLNLYLTATNNAQVVLELPSAPWTQTVNVPANNIIKVSIPNLLGGGAGGLLGTSTGVGFPQNNVVEDLAIHVTSDEPISIYSANEVTSTMEIYLAIPNVN